MSGRAVGLLACLLAACWSAGTSGAASDNAALDALMARLRQRQHGRATFTERHVTALLKRPLEASGELSYDAPDRLEMRTLRPRPERIVLDHGSLTIERRNKTMRIALADFPQVAPYLDAVRATLAGDREGLERAFITDFVPVDGQWSLELTPRDAAVAAQVAHVRIDGTGADIRALTILFANGDRSVMTLANAAAN
jgi:outer membrane lipoprotein-sorting protein